MRNNFMYETRNRPKPTGKVWRQCATFEDMTKKNRYFKPKRKDIESAEAWFMQDHANKERIKNQRGIKQDYPSLVIGNG